MDRFENPFHSAIWDSADAARLKDLLQQKTGKRLILRLRLDRPMLPTGAAGKDLQSVALAAKQLEGYEQCLANIFDYIQTEPAKDAHSQAYPHLDDEAAWPEELKKLTRDNETTTEP